MPYYSFVCPNCQHKIDNVRQSLAEHEVKIKCPHCQVEMEQVFDTLNYILKDQGSGWCKHGYSKRRK